MVRARDWRGRFCRASNHLSHGHTIGGKLSPTYVSFLAARQRCSDNHTNRWKFYGGAGVKFLWRSFPQFLAELHARPRGRSLSRVADQGDYGPGLGNYWATGAQQRAERFAKHQGFYNRQSQEGLI